MDFGDRNFDESQIIQPARPDRTFWKKAYDVALADLAALVAPSRVVICEGQPLTSQPVRNHSLDARCYGRIFEGEFPETEFVSMGSDQQIVGDQRGLVETLHRLIGGIDVVRLIDRDDRSEEEVADLVNDGVRVLSRRNLESYLFDDELLQALAESAGKEAKIEELLSEKANIVATSSGGSVDDLKPVSGQIYVACKQELDLTQVGNNTQAFMRDTLAPLVKPEMVVYAELKRDVFGSPMNS